MAANDPLFAVVIEGIQHTYSRYNDFEKLCLRYIPTSWDGDQDKEREISPKGRRPILQ